MKEILRFLVDFKEFDAKTVCLGGAVDCVDERFGEGKKNELMLCACEMVAGKKTMASTFPDFSSKFSKPGNSAVSHRNLSKSDLGGMIFGCKHYTMAECLSKLLFEICRTFI
ncbi:putative development/cell death domain-containing protein [Dioscorea sansibarensis]